jgi:tryptophan synthase beta subunit
VGKFKEEKLSINRLNDKMIRDITGTDNSTHIMHSFVQDGCDMPLIEVKAAGENIQIFSHLQKKCY